jgi:4-hydroxyphenylpyruvate dioxygenase-like putative hemolysin
MLSNEICAQPRKVFRLMKGPLSHYNKVPIVAPAQWMDHVDISNTAENTEAFSVAYQQLVTCLCIQFSGTSTNLRKRLLISSCQSVRLSVSLSFRIELVSR